MNRQEAFDKALNGVRLQGCKSINDQNTCAYRATIESCHMENSVLVKSIKVIKCGVGHLIPDDLYREEFDRGGSVETQWHDNELFKDAIMAGVGSKDLDYDEIGFLSKLQNAHDYADGPNDNFMANFERRMRDLAGHAGLVYTVAV